MNILGIVIVLAFIFGLLIALYNPRIFVHLLIIFVKLFIPIIVIGYLVYYFLDSFGSPKTEHYFASNYTLAVNTVKKCKTLNTMSEKKQFECENAKNVVEKTDTLSKNAASDFKDIFADLMNYYTTHGEFAKNVNDMTQKNPQIELFGVEGASFVVETKDQAVSNIYKKTEICRLTFKDREFNPNTYELSSGDKKGKIVIK